MVDMATSETFSVRVGQPVMLPSGQTIQIVNSPAPVNHMAEYPKTLIRITSWVVIALSCLIMILQVVATVEFVDHTVVGGGLWCGFFMLLTGLLARLSVSKPSACLIIAVMVMCIVTCSLFATTLLGLSSANLAMCGYRWYSVESESLCRVLAGLILLSSLVEAVLLILIAAGTCRGVCSCCKEDRSRPVVIYQQRCEPQSSVNVPLVQGAEGGILYAAHSSPPPYEVTAKAPLSDPPTNEAYGMV